MLSLMTPEMFRERFAFWLLQDNANPRWHRAQLIAEVHNTVTRYAAAKSGRRPTRRELLSADELITPLFGGKDTSLPAAEDIDPDSLARSLGCIE